MDRGKRVVDEFHPGGEFIREFTGAGAPGGFQEEPAAVAIDPTTGNVLVSVKFNGIDEFDPTAATSARSPTPLKAAKERHSAMVLQCIAVNSKGDLYIDPGIEAPAMDIFTRTPEYPSLSYRPISNLSRDSVTLGASVGPYEGGPITECRFEYGTDTEYTPSAANPA